MEKNHSPLYYSDYLQLPTILNAQHPISRSQALEKHDEMLFIVVHQAHELWFKQLLHELSSLTDILVQTQVQDDAMLILTRRLHRITVIQKLLIEQLNTLNTLSPMEFLEFRELLDSASGFQSAQFKCLEIKLGIEETPSGKNLSPEDQALLNEMQQQISLFDAVGEWLARTPFLTYNDFKFWRSYQSIINHMFEEEQQKLTTSSLLSDEQKRLKEKELQQMSERFANFFDREKYQDMLSHQERRMSFDASQAALFICLYRDKPALQLPYQIINYLIQLDDNLTTWRQKHMMIAQRIIGSKMGTGGSSGVRYLNRQLTKSIFNDLRELSTYMLPSSQLPILPDAVEAKLGFCYAKGA